MGSTYHRSLRRKANRGLGRRAGIATAIFLGVAGVSVQSYQPAFAQSYAFSSVRVEGNERVDAATIMGFAGIDRGTSVTAGALNDAYQNIQRSGLFETVEVEPQGATLVIRVREYPFVNVINFEGNKSLKDEILAEVISSQSRRAYSPSSAEADAAAIAELYRVRGRMAASVQPKIIRRDGNRVDLVFEIAEGKVVEIERLSFVGNRDFSDRRLRQVLETKQAGLLRNLIQRDTFVAERLEMDKQLLTDFYRSRGYIDFQITDVSAETSRERDATFVTFSIKEGLPYAIGNVTTVSEVEGVDASEFIAVQKIKPGQVWNPALIDNNITRMENLALKKGLNFLRIEPRTTRDNRNQRINVEFAIVRGERIFVERIDIEGNATTLDHVVRRQFRSVEGDPFNPREIRQSAERIRALGYFSDAQVNAEPGSAADQVVVNVDVEEQPTGSLGFGLSYSVSGGMGANVSLSESNFLGRGQTIGASISTTSDNQNSSFTFTEPSLMGRDLSFTIGAYYRTSDNDYSRYNTRNLGFTTGIGFPLGEQSRIDLRYRISDDRLFDYASNGGDSDILIDEENAGPDGDGSMLTSSLGYTYNYDDRITGVNPDGGLLLRFGQDFAGLGGDTKYISTTALAMVERRVMAGDVTLRAIVEAGYLHSLSDNTTRVTERFFGNGKIRGFEPNGIGPRDGDEALGGNAFAAARFEAEFPVGLPEEYGIMGGAFVDIGSVWSLDQTPSVQAAGIDDGFEPRVAVGLSILWDTALGPLRFNFSKAVKKQDYDKEQSFDLTIQTKF